MPTTHEIPVTPTESIEAVHHAVDADRWVVFCHGFRSDKSGSYERRCRRATAAGYQAVRFDARGCGNADGTFAESTLGNRLADVRAVLEHFDPASVVAFGSSFGGAVAFRAGTDDRVDAVVTRAPVTYGRAFDAYREVVERDGQCRFDDGTAIDRRFFEDLDRHPFADVAAALEVPVAIFHGAADESVDVADSVEATAALETDVALHTFRDEGHLFSEDAERRMLDLTVAWLETVFGEP